jgi:hypothetical protein
MEENFTGTLQVSVLVFDVLNLNEFNSFQYFFIAILKVNRWNFPSAEMNSIHFNISLLPFLK